MLMWTDPLEILPKRRHLLEIDFGDLRGGSAIDRKHWIVSIESAERAAEQVRLKSEMLNELRDLYEDSAE